MTADNKLNTPSPNDTTNQKDALFTYLLAGNRLTVGQALVKFGCYALSQRLGDLRRNHNIPVQSQFITLPNGKRIKEYWLEPSYIQSVKGA